MFGKKEKKECGYKEGRADGWRAGIEHAIMSMIAQRSEYKIRSEYAKSNEDRTIWGCYIGAMEKEVEYLFSALTRDMCDIDIEKLRKYFGITWMRRF